jgi:hypothetical protein
MNRRGFLRLGLGGIVAGSCGVRLAAQPPTLYNGIQLPETWPPRYTLTRQPIVPRYLTSPPSIIPIDVGRQLFVDDFLIQETTLARVFHRPTASSANPVFRPTEAWERQRYYTEPAGMSSIPPAMPTAMVFSDGVVYDGESQQFKLWYMGGFRAGTCYAVSSDGERWTKPQLDVVPGTNAVLNWLDRDSAVVWLDRATTNRAERYKMATFFASVDAMLLHTSPDGVHWNPAGQTGFVGDRTTFFYNPFRSVWAFSIRDDDHGPLRRFRRYMECADFKTGSHWNRDEPVPWMTADELDLPDPELKVQTELYNLDAVAYESLMLGLFAIFRGDRAEDQKACDISVGYSRDGFHWTRPERKPFIGMSDDPQAWNHGNVQSAGGCCLVVGDQLYFYVSGRRGNPANVETAMCSTGLYTLRRDGFASMMKSRARVDRAAGPVSSVSSLTTRPVRFNGRYLFVNADLGKAGKLAVEILDERGRPLKPYQRATCVPLSGDGTKARVTWKGAADLGDLRGQVVRFRFWLSDGHLYAFWVSRTERGESGGYLGAGGPGFEGVVDE